MSSILGDSGEGRFSQPPAQLNAGKKLQQGMEHRSQSLNTDDRRATETALVTEGVHRDLSSQVGPDQFAQIQTIKRKPLATTSRTSSSGSDEDDEDSVALTRLQTAFNRSAGPHELPPFRSSIYNARTTDDLGRRGQAHDPLEDQLYLRIGPSTFAGHSTQLDGETFFPDDDVYMVSESPGAADVDIYETAYRDEIERILARAEENNQEPQVYLTRRVDEKLLQLSGLAGKLMAHGEEAKTQIKDYTQFTARKARVADVSRALREAARTEYEKRRSERKEWIETAKAERARRTAGEPSGYHVDTERPPFTPMSGASMPRPLESTNSWRAKAVDRGRSAKTAFSGLVSQVKKNRR